MDSSNEGRLDRDAFQAELERRLDMYYDIRPGQEDGEIPPMKLKHFLPAIIISIVLTVYLIAAMIGFGAFYPG